MEKKSIWTTVLIAAIVGIISSVITSFFISSPDLQPTNINANSCNADGICEVNELQTLNGPVRMTNPSWYIFFITEAGADP